MTLPLPARPAAAVVRRRLDPWRAVGFACSLAAFAPNPVAAVGLGPVTQQSALGQSLRVVVPVTLGPDEDLASECFKIAAAERDADGIPQLLFGRINVERSPSGTALVITNARTVNDPIVRLTIQAGCEATIRREYTLFMDPPAIETPVVAAEAPPRETAVAPPPAPVAREARRPPPPRARASTRTATAPAPDSAGAEVKGKPAPQKGRVAAKAAPKRPPPVATERPRLSLSSGAPGTGAGGAATVADRERAQREQAAAIEAETRVLQQRIVELTALVERMQQELRAQEQAEQEAAAAAKAAAPQEPAASTPAEPAKAASASAVKASPTAPATDWWDDNAVLIAVIVLLPLLIAAGLLWKRRRAAADDDQWRTARTVTPRTEHAAESPAPALRNPTAGLASGSREPATMTTPKDSDRIVPSDAVVDALAVSELSHVTEEARVFVALGHPERAIEVLQDHIRRLPRSMPAAWLMLLGLHHEGGNRPEFRRLAEDFHAHFNVQAPLWEGFATDESSAVGLEAFPHVQQQVVELWRKPGCRAYLERLLYDNREGRRNGFPLATYGEILLLVQILDTPEDIDIDIDLADVDKLDAAHAAPASQSRPAPAPARTRRPMPPDPAATRPVQQPIRFDLDPTDTRGKPNS